MERIELSEKYDAYKLGINERYETLPDLYVLQFISKRVSYSFFSFFVKCSAVAVAEDEMNVVRRL